MPLSRQHVNTSGDMSVSRVVGGTSLSGWSRLPPGKTSTEFTCVHIYILYIYLHTCTDVCQCTQYVTSTWKSSWLAHMSSSADHSTRRVTRTWTWKKSQLVNTSSGVDHSAKHEQSTDHSTKREQSTWKPPVQTAYNETLINTWCSFERRGEHNFPFGWWDFEIFPA